MATTLACLLKLRGLFNFTDDNDLSDPQDSTSIKWDDTLANGTAINQADVIWHDRRTATAAADDIDLDTSLTDVYGTAADFVKVRGIFIHNRSTVSGEYLSVGGDGNALVNWVGNLSDIVKIGPNGVLLLWSPIDGYAVTAGTGDILQIDPGADTIEYDIVIIGTSA